MALLLFFKPSNGCNELIKTNFVLQFSKCFTLHEENNNISYKKFVFLIRKRRVCVNSESVTLIHHLNTNISANYNYKNFVGFLF